MMRVQTASLISIALATVGALSSWRNRMRGNVFIAAAVLALATASARAQSAVPCNFDRVSVVGTSSTPVKGWIRSGARCGVRFSAPSAIIAVTAAPAHGTLTVDQNELTFMYAPAKG